MVDEGAVSAPGISSCVLHEHVSHIVANNTLATEKVAVNMVEFIKLKSQLQYHIYFRS